MVNYNKSDSNKGNDKISLSLIYWRSEKDFDHILDKRKGNSCFSFMESDIEDKNRLFLNLSDDLKEVNNKPEGRDCISQDENQINVLVAEDDEISYLLIETLLNCCKYRLCRAKNGKEAVKNARDSDVDLILMDIKMPEMNGYEATRKIKSFKPQVPIIAQSAFASGDDKKKAFSSGVDDFITKPLSKEDLFKSISRLMDLQRENKKKENL